MANVIIEPWGETPGEKSLRQTGQAAKSQGILETGGEFSAQLLRREAAGEALKQMARSLYELRNAMANQSWDDDKVLIVYGIQARNGWVRTPEGEWLEEGSPQYLDRIVKKAL